MSSTIVENRTWELSRALIATHTERVRVSCSSFDRGCTASVPEGGLRVRRGRKVACGPGPNVRRSAVRWAVPLPSVSATLRPSPTHRVDHPEGDVSGRT